MNTYRDLVYMCLDQMKLLSDDSYYTEEHIMFLLDKCRSLLLTEKYKNATNNVALSNYQSLCLDLIEVPAISGFECEGGIYLKSKIKVPYLLGIGTPKLHTESFYKSTVSFIPMERMKFVGYNKYLKNIIYASIGPDNYLYLTSSNKQFQYLEKVVFTGVFEDANKALEYTCEKREDTNCKDKLDMEFPIEESLIESLIEYVVKVLSGYVYRPKDSYNNAQDELSDLMAFLRRNMKSNFQKQIE